MSMFKKLYNKSLAINVLQNFLGNLQTTKSEKSRFYSLKSGPGDTQTAVATQKEMAMVSLFKLTSMTTV